MTKLETRAPARGDSVDGRYRLIKTLGRGATGSVWLATQIAVDRTVAVKFLREPERDRFAARFATEARAVAQLKHPNCVTLFDYGYSVSHGTFFIVLEYVEGRPMQSVLDDHAVAPRERVRIVLDVARALRHAHAHGILHRDLKPENVCLTSVEGCENFVKVLDFGLARILDRVDVLPRDDCKPPPQSRRITTHGEAYGTPAFMSPEQAQGDLNVGPPSDIYALGVMLAELLQGHLPVRGKTIRELLYNHVHAEPELEHTIPFELQALLDRMLAKAPADRPTAEVVVEELELWLAREPTAPPPPSRRSSTSASPTPTIIAPPPLPARSPVREAPEARKKRHPVARLVVASTALIVGSTIGVTLLHSDSDASTPSVRPAAASFVPLVTPRSSSPADEAPPVWFLYTAAAPDPEIVPMADAPHAEDAHHAKKPTVSPPPAVRAAHTGSDAPRSTASFEEIRLKL